MSGVITPGLRHAVTMTVDPRLAVPSIFPDAGAFAAMPPVFATAYMIGLMELACVEALQAHLAPHQRTVGTHVSISHCAATPIGTSVTAEVTLTAVRGRRLEFRVVARDAFEVIGKGSHERAIVDLERFMEAMDRKRPSDSTP